MSVLITGASGTVGTAIRENLDGYEFKLLDKEKIEDAGDAVETIVADVTDYDEIRPAFDDVDAVVHLAEYPGPDADLATALDNMRGTGTVIRAVRDADVEQVVYASSNHAQGMYEIEHAPEIYDPAHELVVDHTDPVRPDSLYGSAKVFGEAVGRQFVERYDDGPDQFHALRIGWVRSPESDLPSGNAERHFERGDWTYDYTVDQQRTLWQSRRDLAQLVDCCLDCDDPGFDVFYGVSDNDGRWFDLSQARDVVGYEPRDGADHEPRDGAD